MQLLCHKKKSNYWLFMKEILAIIKHEDWRNFHSQLRENIISLKPQLIKYCVESGKRQNGMFIC